MISTRRVVHVVLGAITLILVGAAIYAPVVHGDWQMDDDLLITKNRAVKSGLWGVMAGFWLEPYGVDYFPLTYSAFWALWRCFGNEPTGYHVVSILLHLGSGLLLWGLLARMRIPGAWASAFAFTIHPACVESVAWVSEMKNTLSLPLFLLSCRAWVAQDECGEGPRQKWLYAASLVTFLLAMCAKPSVVAMPAITLLHAWWKRGRIDARDVVHAVPFFLVSLVLGLVTIAFQHGRAIGNEALPIGGIDSRFAIAGTAVLFYLATIFWPVNLLPIYPAWDMVPPAAWQFFPWFVIAAVGWWTWKHRTGWGRHAIFGLGFFMLMIAPVLGFIDMSYMRLTWVADHFLYVPMIGPIAVAVAAAATWLAGRDARQRSCAALAAGLVAAGLAAGSFLYASEWVSEERLWAYALARNPDAWLPHVRLGMRELDRGDVDAALPRFRRAERLRPDLGETKNMLGAALLKKRRYDEARVVLEEGLEATTCMLDIRANLAAAYCQLGRLAEARDLAEEVMRKQPATASLLTSHGIALCGLGDREGGIAELKSALGIDPDHEPALEALRNVAP